MRKRVVEISLFAGIGGFDLAARWMGWESLIICEIDPFCQHVLKHHFPEAYMHGDIKTLTRDIINHEIEKRLGPDWRATTRLVLVGGFPCQPYSSAGKRLGKEDERHLWPEMLRVIRECRPDSVVGENVSGILNWNGGLVFDEVQADLENEGFEVQAVVLPACAVNAPHRRDRVWFVANTKHYGCDGSQDRHRMGEGENNREARKAKTSESTGCANQDAIPYSDPAGTGRKEWIQGGGWANAKKDGARLVDESQRLGCAEYAAHAHIIDGDDPGFRPGEIRLQEPSRIQAQSLAAGADTDPGCKRLEGGEFNGTPHEKSKGGWQQPSRPAPELHQAGDWSDWPIVSPIHTGDDGVPDRLGHSRLLEGMRGKPREPYVAYNRLNKLGLKASGNAIVPQVVFQVFKALEATWVD